MIIPEKEIDIVLNLIKEKTSVIIPQNIIFIEETEWMKKKKTLAGTYFENRISLNPDIFSIRTDREYYKEEAFGNTIRYNGALSRIDTEEKLTIFMNQEIQRKILWNIHYVIAHECGHYVHDNYFGNCALRIPIKSGGGTHGRNSHKNPRENFADGFAEYVLDLFLKKDSKRAKRMRSIIDGIRYIKENEDYFS